MFLLILVFEIFAKEVSNTANFILINIHQCDDVLIDIFKMKLLYIRHYVLKVLPSTMQFVVVN